MWNQVLCGLDGECRPASRGRHTAALAPNGEMIVFGGQNYDRRAKYNDVHALTFGDKPAWSRRTQNERRWDDDLPPQSRSSHSSVTVGKHMFIIGGALKFDVDSGSKGDRTIWRYTFAKDCWREMDVKTLLPDGTPTSTDAERNNVFPTRFGHVTIHRSAVSFSQKVDGETVTAEIYLHGGRTHDGCLSQLLKLDVCKKGVVRVRRIEMVGEELPAVFGHTAVYVERHDSAYIFGGGTIDSVERSIAPFSSQFLKLNFGTMESSVVPQTNAGPSERYVHCATTDVFQRVMFVFGGYNGAYLSDMWEFHFDTGIWRQLARERSPSQSEWPPTLCLPLPRSGSTIVHHPKLNKLIVFGGCDQDKYFDDVWACDAAATRRHYTLRELVMMYIVAHGIRVPTDALPEASSLRTSVEALANMSAVDAESRD